MQKIHYLKIQNFKIFGDEITINFDETTVLIGANNAGKTTAIQALALWNWAVRIWFEKKKNAKSNKGVALNRLDIAQVPIKETRFFWHNARVKQNSSTNIGLTLKVGLWFDNAVREVAMTFTYHSPELMYCQPTPETLQLKGLLEYANNLNINLLYPMSGLSKDEDVLQEGSIKRNIGTGETAKVIRNICYALYNQEENGERKKWGYLVKLMRNLFSIEILPPIVRTATGTIELVYNYTKKEQKTTSDLDITLAGRGQQQMLLVLAYLLSNNGSVLMIDEPDAHLEILRQNQIFSVLREVGKQYDCQIIIVTHSEVVLNEANSIIFFADGKAQEISDKSEHKVIKDALKEFGIEHYYKARVSPRILYIESSTDKDMLKAFAKRFDHPALSYFDDKLNQYYTQNEVPEVAQDIENYLERNSGYYKPCKAHFKAIQGVVPDFKGIGIFDSDNKTKQDEVKPNLAIVHWKEYELENYFISPEIVEAYIEETFASKYDSLFIAPKKGVFYQIFEHKFLLPLFNDDKNLLNIYNVLQNKDEKTAFFQSQRKDKKTSELLENVFREYAKQTHERMLLGKGEFYKLIQYLNELPQEVKEKLDLIIEYLHI